MALEVIPIWASALTLMKATCTFTDLPERTVIFFGGVLRDVDVPEVLNGGDRDSIGAGGHGEGLRDLPDSGFLGDRHPLMPGERYLYRDGAGHDETDRAVRFRVARAACAGIAIRSDVPIKVTEMRAIATTRTRPG